MSGYKLKDYLIIGSAIVIIVYAIETFRNKAAAQAPPKVNKVGRNIIIGDSHGVGISAITKSAKAEKGLAKSGWTLGNVLAELKTKGVDNGVARVFISIGTNGQFSTSDDVATFINTIKAKFPQTTIYVYGGSYGWSGTRTRATLEDRFAKYYKRFADMGVYVLKNKLGYFTTDAGAHSVTTPQAKAIAKEIDDLSK
jgi:23S rRNA pseudoU1915 N3-methylase RlmH